MKAFLGMGLLGANFVRAMISKGEQVQVWNRTPQKAKELEQYGAKAFAQATDAVKGADIIHLTLKDDAAIDEVLATVKPALMPGAIIIDHTTTSADGAVKRTNNWKKDGFTYVHAPVFMGPENALQSTGIMLVSGDQDVINKLEPHLSRMTGKVINLGNETGKAAGIKLVGNAFLVSFTTGIADTLLLAKALHIPSSDVAMLLDLWNPGAMVQARIKRLTTGNYEDPSWKLNMARKDTQLFINAAKDGGTQLAVLPAIAAFMDQWIAKGHGDDDWTVIAKEAR